MRTPESFGGISVLYRGHRRGSGGPPGGATPLGGPHGPQGARNQPLVGWCAPPGPPHAPRVGNPRGGGAPLALGGKPPLGRRPPSRSHLEGPAPLAPSPINRGVRGGLQHTTKAQPLPSPTPLLLRHELGEALPEYCFSTNTTPSCCRWSCLPQPLLPPCWIKTEETSPVPYVC